MSAQRFQLCVWGNPSSSLKACEDLHTFENCPTNNIKTVWPILKNSIMLTWWFHSVQRRFWNTLEFISLYGVPVYPALIPNWYWCIRNPPLFILNCWRAVPFIYRFFSFLCAVKKHCQKSNLICICHCLKIILVQYLLTYYFF